MTAEVIRLVNSPQKFINIVCFKCRENSVKGGLIIEGYEPWASIHLTDEAKDWEFYMSASDERVIMTSYICPICLGKEEKCTQ